MKALINFILKTSTTNKTANISFQNTIRNNLSKGTVLIQSAKKIRHRQGFLLFLFLYPFIKALISQGITEIATAAVVKSNKTKATANNSNFHRSKSLCCSYLLKQWIHWIARVSTRLITRKRKRNISRSNSSYSIHKMKMKIKCILTISISHRYTL